MKLPGCFDVLYVTATGNSGRVSADVCVEGCRSFGGSGMSHVG